MRPRQNPINDWNYKILESDSKVAKYLAAAEETKRLAEKYNKDSFDCEDIIWQREENAGLYETY